ncbi:MAG: hypothetical protein PVSMB4_16990 [Ktedonobacterales bacterium]
MVPRANFLASSDACGWAAGLSFQDCHFQSQAGGSLCGHPGELASAEDGDLRGVGERIARSGFGSRRERSALMAGLRA